MCLANGLVLVSPRMGEYARLLSRIDMEARQSSSCPIQRKAHAPGDISVR